MGLNLNDKKAVVAEVSAQVANAQTIVIAEYRGIEVTDLTVLRKDDSEDVHSYAEGSRDTLEATPRHDN